MLVFDITSKDSFDNLQNQLDIINANKSENCEIIIVGNKLDLNNEWQVSTEEAMLFANE